MDEIRRVGVECVGRAVMFGALAIGCVMLGFSFNPVSAFRFGAVLTLMLSLALMWKAMTAGSKHPKYTEVWLYLDRNSRPVDSQARQIFATVMRDIYGAYAQMTLAVAIGLFVASGVLMLFGFQAYTPPEG